MVFFHFNTFIYLGHCVYRDGMIYTFCHTNSKFKVRPCRWGLTDGQTSCLLYGFSLKIRLNNKRLQQQQKTNKDTFITPFVQFIILIRSDVFYVCFVLFLFFQTNNNI